MIYVITLKILLQSNNIYNIIMKVITLKILLQSNNIYNIIKQSDNIENIIAKQ
jgi:hypothetical protein